MRFWKFNSGGIIKAIGTGSGGTEIPEEEYRMILAIIRARPVPPEGYDCCLREDLTWEFYETPAEEEDPEAAPEDYEEQLGRFGV